MATQTEHYEFIKPGYSDTRDIKDINDNMDDLDAILYNFNTAINALQTAVNGKAGKSEAIKTITRSGTTFTATLADGSTFTFTQQDNDHYAWSDITGKPTFSGGSTTLQWNTESTIATVANNAVKVKLPANPDTWRGIQNNLESFSTTESLSALQGRRLNNMIQAEQMVYNGATNVVGGKELNISYNLDNFAYLAVLLSLDVEGSSNSKGVLIIPRMFRNTNAHYAINVGGNTGGIRIYVANQTFKVLSVSGFNALYLQTIYGSINRAA